MRRLGPFGFGLRRSKHLLERLKPALDEVGGAVELLWGTPSVQARFEETYAQTIQS